MASKENNVYSRFSFCGKVTVSKKVPFVKRDTYDKGEKISINFGIKAREQSRLCQAGRLQERRDQDHGY